MLNSASHAQSISYEESNAVPLSESGVLLPNAWAGGINAGQFQKIDVNQDGFEDLVIFEKSTEKLSIFITTPTGGGASYIYAPGAERSFPKIDSYFALRDYDCDGKKDLFTRTQGGFTIFKNTSQAGAGLSWSNQTNNSAVSYTYTDNSGNSYVYNLQISGADYPSFEDVDGDGDIDVFTFSYTGGSTVEYYKNMAVENHQGDCSFTDLHLVTTCFGQFTESANCSNPYTFNAMCREGKIDTSSVNKTLHTGSTVTYADVTGDNQRDFLIGDISCPNLYVLTNKGSSEMPAFGHGKHVFSQQLCPCLL